MSHYSQNNSDSEVLNSLKDELQDIHEKINKFRLKEKVLDITSFGIFGISIVLSTVISAEFIFLMFLSAFLQLGKFTFVSIKRINKELEFDLKLIRFNSLFGKPQPHKNSNNQPNNFFKECTTLDEVKKVYKAKAKTFHPDNGGNVQQFHNLNNQYNQAKKTVQRA